MKTITLYAMFLILGITFSNAQQILTNKDGKQVKLKADGTWSYVKTTTVNKPKFFGCDDLIITETDKVTGKTSIASKTSLVISEDNGKNGFGIFMMKSNKSIIISTKAVGSGSCIDDDAKMNLLFTDGTRLELTNNGKFNCKSRFTLYLGGAFGNKKTLEDFQTKTIDIMRIWTTKSYVESSFSPEQAKIFKQTISCLANI